MFFFYNLTIRTLFSYYVYMLGADVALKKSISRFSTFSMVFQNYIIRDSTVAAVANFFPSNLVTL